jgi:uncharacterized phage protein gp47/JayE
MIDVSEKTQEILLNYMLGLTPDTLNKREGSLIRTSLAAAAWAMEGLYINLEYVQKQAYGTTATGTYLDKIAATAGLVRKPATYAQLNARFNIEIPIGTRFVKDTDDGDRVYFDLVSIVESPSTDPKYVDAPYLGVVEAEEAGSYPNILRGDLSLISFVVGLTTATIVDVHEYGVDEETDALLRARYLEAIGRVDFGGNIQSYRNYVLAQEGVGACQVWPCWNGPGTVAISVVSPMMTPVESDRLEILQNLICPPEAGDTEPSANGYGMAPIGAQVVVKTPSLVEMGVDLYVKLSPSNTRTQAEITQDIYDGIVSYLKSTTEDWGTMRLWNLAQYDIVIYATKVIVVCDAVEGVEAVTACMVRKGDEQWSLSSVTIPQTAESQGIPDFPLENLIIHYT